MTEDEGVDVETARLQGLARLYHHLPTWLLRERLVDIERGVMGPVPVRYARYLEAERADAARKLALVRAELARRGELEA